MQYYQQNGVYKYMGVNNIIVLIALRTGDFMLSRTVNIYSECGCTSGTDSSSTDKEQVIVAPLASQKFA